MHFFAIVMLIRCKKKTDRRCFETMSLSVRFNHSFTYTLAYGSVVSVLMYWIMTKIIHYFNVFPHTVF